MDLIYYLPPTRKLAGDYVANCVFDKLIENDNILPFDNVVVYSPKMPSQQKNELSNKSSVSLEFCDSISNLPSDSILHLPINVFLFPNKDLHLYLDSLLKKRKLVMNYHGDLRVELKYEFETNRSLGLIHFPAYIFWPSLLKSFDVTIFNSPRMHDYAKSAYNLKNGLVIPNGLDDYWYHDTIQTNSCEFDGDPKIFFHGRLVPQKGVDVLIEAFQSVSQDYPKAKLFIAGAGQSEKAFKKMVIKYGLEKNIIFLGYVENIKQCMSKMDAAIYPSTYEPFSIAVLEAFSSVNGPVFYSNLAGINDFVFKDNFEFNTFEPTLSGTRSALEKICSFSKNSNITSNQKEFSKRYSWDVISLQYIEVYDNLIED